MSSRGARRAFETVREVTMRHRNCSAIALLCLTQACHLSPEGSKEPSDLAAGGERATGAAMRDVDCARPETLIAAQPLPAVGGTRH